MIEYPKLDILAIGAHPDDVEIGAAGTLIKEIHSGKKAGIIDLSRGELATRGNPDTREKEATKSSEIISISIRENLNITDGFIENSRANKIKLIQIIRKLKPEIILCNSIDRHPDHRYCYELCRDSFFLSGLLKLKTSFNGKEQEPWKPKKIFQYLLHTNIKPHFVIDISNYIDKKIECIKSYKSQFYDKASKEPQTFISTKEFLDSVIYKSQELGRIINVRYAEGFFCENYIGLNSFDNII